MKKHLLVVIILMYSGIVHTQVQALVGLTGGAADWTFRQIVANAILNSTNTATLIEDKFSNNPQGGADMWINARSHPRAYYLFNYDYKQTKLAGLGKNNLTLIQKDSATNRSDTSNVEAYSELQIIRLGFMYNFFDGDFLLGINASIHGSYGVTSYIYDLKDSVQSYQGYYYNAPQRFSVNPAIVFGANICLQFGIPIPQGNGELFYVGFQPCINFLWRNDTAGTTYLPPRPEIRICLYRTINH